MSSNRATSSVLWEIKDNDDELNLDHPPDIRIGSPASELFNSTYTGSGGLIAIDLATVQIYNIAEEGDL